MIEFGYHSPVNLTDIAEFRSDDNHYLGINMWMKNGKAELQLSNNNIYGIREIERFSQWLQEAIKQIKRRPSY